VRSFGESAVFWGVVIALVCLVYLGLAGIIMWLLDRRRRRG